MTFGLNMNPNSDRLLELFGGAIELESPAERARFVDEACQNDASLRRQLEALLRAHEEAGPFLDPLPEIPPPAAPVESPGDRIGRYKLLQKIGEGGCGVVYMAEQEEPVRRKVALKVIKRGMDTRSVIARFEAERQALALMDHPNIARILDAGTTDAGRPFFVMELVRGIKITDYCDQTNLPTAARLTLFVQVCQAIQHAHQKGVIHRDIKPSNILVTVNDGVAVPKVIDFGIAKATEQKLTDKTLFTAFEQFIGTPAYMSPEQAAMTSLDIDTRSDIYSLGVLLYELLTGGTPFDTRKLLRAGLDEIRRTIREVEPPRPSTRLSAMIANDLTAVASQRQSEPTRLAALIRGDLDWIVMKCLEKDRQRRYETANGLALDIQRHLRHELIAARAPSPTYRLRKFARRNQLAVTAATVVLIVLVLGAGVSTWQAVRAGRAEQIARRTAYIAEMNLAQQAVTDGNLGRARQLLAHHLPAPGQPDLRGWEWRYLARLGRGDESQSLRGHASGITGICFLDDDQLLSVGWDRRAIWWDVTQGRATRTLTNSVRTDGLAVSPGKDFAVLNGVNEFAPHDLVLLDLKLQRERETPLRATDRKFAVIDFSPAGELAIGTRGQLGLWDALTGTNLAELPVGDIVPNAVRFSPDGRLLAVANQQGDIQMWAGASRSNLISWHAHDREGGLFITVNSLAFSPDGHRLVSAGADGKVCAWEPSTGQLLTVLEDHRDPVAEVSFSPDGHWLAGGSLDQKLYVWETANWKLTNIFRGHSGEIRRLAWSPNSRRLASGGSDGELLLWDWPPRTNSVERKEFPAAAGFDLPATGDTLLRVTADAPPLVEIWDPKTFQRTARFPNPDTNIISSWMLPGGRLIATGDRGGRVGIRELATGRELTGTNAHTAEVIRLAGSPDGRTLVTISVDREARVWTLPALTPRNTFRLDNVFDAAAVTSDGSLLAVGYTYGQIDLRNLPGGSRRTTWRTHPLNFKALAFSPDGKLLASSSWDRTGKLWDVGRGQLLRTLGGNLLTIESLAFSPDGSRLAAGTAEGTVKLYDAQTAQEILTLKGHRHPVYALAFTPDGTDLVSASAEALSVWRAPSFAEIEAIEKSGRQNR